MIIEKRLSFHIMLYHLFRCVTNHTLYKPGIARLFANREGNPHEKAISLLHTYMVDICNL